MKMKNVVLSMLAVVVILISGCKKEETTTVPDASALSPGKSQISFKAAGASTSSFNSNILISTAVRSAQLMNISGSAVSGLSAEIFMLILPANIKAGTYSSTTSSTGDFQIVYTKGETGWGSDSNKALTLVVTKVTDNTIEGTFSGKLINDELVTEVTVSEGKFAAKF